MQYMTYILFAMGAITVVAGSFRHNKYHDDASITISLVFLGLCAMIAALFFIQNQNGLLP